MKLACLSDPHSDIQISRGYPKFLEKLQSFFQTQEFDVLLVTGDVSGSTAGIQQFLQSLEALEQPKLYVPGNHDIWVNSASKDGSWIKYYSVLKELCIQYNWHFLPKHPITIENVGFAGTIGWYDYSTRNNNWDTKFTMDDYKEKVHPETGSVWMDREFVRFNYDDPIVAQHFNADLLEDISWILQNDHLTGFNKIQEVDSKLMETNVNSNIETLVIGTHIVPFRDMVLHTNDTKWDFFSAFIGNQSLGDMLIQISNLVNVLSISGHTHFPKKYITEGLNAYCVPIGYPHEWTKKHSSIEELFRSRIKIIEL